MPERFLPGYEKPRLQPNHEYVLWFSISLRGVWFGNKIMKVYVCFLSYLSVMTRGLRMKNGKLGRWYFGIFEIIYSWSYSQIYRSSYIFTYLEWKIIVLSVISNNSNNMPKIGALSFVSLRFWEVSFRLSHLLKKIPLKLHIHWYIFHHYYHHF